VERHLLALLLALLLGPNSQMEHDEPDTAQRGRAKAGGAGRWRKDGRKDGKNERKGRKKRNRVIG
jgi:hypothetical protein